MNINLINTLRQSGLHAKDNEMIDLANEVDAIITYVEQLKNIKTTHVKPFQHPENHHQAMRPDTPNNTDLVDSLKQNAPCFEKGLFLVPAVL